MKFYTHVNPSTIKNSIQFNPGVVICYLETEKNIVEIKTSGNLEVFWNPNGINEKNPGTVYNRASDYPVELVELLNNPFWIDDPRIKVKTSNKFEILCLDETMIISSDIQLENCDAAKLLQICLKYSQNQLQIA